MRLIMSENINDLCGTINGRPITGYHVVLYGETQEYLESLVEKGVILMYSEDNPKEEGKLTVAKPSTMPEWLRDYATNVVYDEYGNFVSCSVEGLITLAENPTEEDIAEVNQNTYYYSPGSATGPAVLVSEDAKTADTTDTDTEDTTTDTDPAVADINNYLCPGVRIHIVQYGETQEYLESLAKEGYMMVYLEDNPPEEGKLTISKPNPEPDPITITAVSEPINIQELVLTVDFTEEEIAETFHIVREIVFNNASPRIILKSTADTARDYGEGWSVIGRGDFNGNGSTMDVLVTNPTAASDTVGLIGYWENDSEWKLIGGYSPEWDVLETADFNGDGKTDILWRNSFVGEDGNTYNAYCTWIMDESDSWRMVSASNADEWEFLCTGDFDGDGTADIAMINASGLVSIWGVSDGRLSADAVLSAVDTSEWKFATVGDFNGDGTDDIMWAHTDGAVYAADRYGYWQIDDGQLASWESGSAGLIFLSERIQPLFATLA